MAKKENKTTVILYGCVALIVVIIAALFISYEADSSSLTLGQIGLLIIVSSLFELLAFAHRGCKLNGMAVSYALLGVISTFVATGSAFPKLYVLMMILSCLTLITASFIVYFDYLDNRHSR